MTEKLSFYERRLLDIVRRLGADEQIRLLHIAAALLPEDEFLSKASSELSIVHFPKEDGNDIL